MTTFELAIALSLPDSKIVLKPIVAEMLRLGILRRTAQGYLTTTDMLRETIDKVDINARKERLADSYEFLTSEGVDIPLFKAYTSTEVCDFLANNLTFTTNDASKEFSLVSNSDLVESLKKLVAVDILIEMQVKGAESSLNVTYMVVI
jgi:hypothetical protein